MDATEATRTHLNEPPERLPLLLSAPEAARHVGVGLDAFRRLAREHGLPFFAGGKQKRYRVSDLRELVDHLMVHPRAAAPSSGARGRGQKQSIFEFLDSI